MPIPKKIRDVLGFAPGSAVEFDVDEEGRIFIRKADEKHSRRMPRRDRFDRARGRATITCRTDELMRLLRGDECVAIVDTNVLVDVLEDDPDWVEWSAGRMREIRRSMSWPSIR
ncbi:MAG: AbrB/MazE/SpoVT family DNA-binding domain-containing protein [Methylococcaceae bacterium]|nr:AbrB/MazE/SpoVT family DNA-binding domain-containing protein [Methylococcaceae bacterium]